MEIHLLTLTLLSQKKYILNTFEETPTNIELLGIVAKRIHIFETMIIYEEFRIF